MKTPAQLGLVASSLALAACSTISTSTDYDRLTTFESCKTYAWAAEPKTETVTLGADVRSAVEQQLAMKGLKKIDGKRPDLFVVYHFTGAAPAGANHYTEWSQPGSTAYRGWRVTTQTDAAIEKAKPGALVLDFVDARRQQLVWRSVAPEVIAGPKGDDAQRVHGSVKVMLAGFPPK